MNLKSERFGNLTIDPKDLIDFPAGLIGFPNENKFILIRQRESSPIAWLHSATNPGLAFPVISLEALSVEYGEDEIVAAAADAGVTAAVESLSVMLVFAAPGKDVPPTVNLVAPIVVDSETRTGAQILLEGTKLTACEPMSSWLSSDAMTATSPSTRTRRAAEPQMAADGR